MLQIKNESGLTLHLPVDQRLTVEINSTIFDTDDIIRGSYSYPFSFGLNENNCRFIGYSHLPESPVVPEMKVQVTADSYSFSALLTFKTSGLSADAALLIDLGELADKIRDVSLREFVTESFFVGTDEISSSATLMKLATAEPNVYPVVFPPFHNSEMVEEGWLPRDANGNDIKTYKRPTIVNVFYPGLPGLYSGTTYGSGDRLLVPMVYMCWLINYICRKLGFTASGSLFSDPVLSRLIIFNTQTIAGLNIDQGGYTVEVGRHLGDQSISSFLKAIRSYIGVSIDINTASRKAVFNTYKSMSTASGYVDISEGIVPESEGVESSQTKGYVINAFQDSADKYIRYSPFPLDTNSIRPKELQTSFTFAIGGKQQPVSMEVGTPRMDTFKSTSNPAGPDWLLPAVQQPGNLADPFFEKSANYSPYYDPYKIKPVPELTNSFGLRMLVYWGMKEDTAGDLYPYASSVSYDSKYRVFGDLSLQPGEPDDIWHRYQRAYYEFLAYSKKVSVLARLNLGKLSQLNPSMPVGFNLKNHVHGRYLLEKLTYELPATTGWVLAKFEGRQLNPKLLRAQPSVDGKLINCWIQLKLENLRSENNSNNSQQTHYGDIVAYVWRDGLYTIPETTLGFQCEYKRCITDYDVNQFSNTVCEKQSKYIFGHRTVIEPNMVWMIAGNPRGLIKFVTWAMLDGSGYRAR